MKLVSVFGSASPMPGEPEYEQAQALGRLLASSGFAVATGGYVGTMEGVSRGAAEAGGHVIGVTSAQIEQFRPIGANPWVRQEIKYPTLRERLLHLVTHNDGIVTLPGGIGTLSELSLAWSFLQVAEIAPRPLVVVGSLWQETLRPLLASPHVQPRYAALVQFAATVDDAARIILEGCGDGR
jgi:uncharacterized protein (TIGR00730 family)